MNDNHLQVSARLKTQQLKKSKLQSPFPLRSTTEQCSDLGPSGSCQQTWSCNSHLC